MNETEMALVALGLVGGSLVLWFRRLWKVDIPRDRTAFVVVWLSGLGMAVLALALGRGRGLPVLLPSVLAIGAAMFALTAASISRQKVGADAIAVGDRIPHFKAPDQDGNEFDSADLAGRMVLLKFFRGHW